MHPLRLAHQPDKDVQGVTVTVFGALAQRGLHTSLPKRPVESSKCVAIPEGELRKFWNPFRLDQQIHVPQMTVVLVRIIGEALCMGAYQRDRCVPILKLLRSSSSLQPVHRPIIGRCPSEQQRTAP